MSNAKKVKRPKLRTPKAVHQVRILPYLELWGNWEASRTEDLDPLFSFKNHDVKKGNTREISSKSRDVFDTARAFFSVKSADDALEFFQEYGPFQLSTGEAGKMRRVAKPIRFSAVLVHRDFWLSASQGKLKFIQKASTASEIRTLFDGLRVALPLHAELQFGSPIVGIRCLDVEDALRASIHVDKLNGLSWGLCAWKKCGKPFRIGSHRDKKFCDAKCAGKQTSSTWWSKPENRERSNNRRRKGG